MKGKERKKEKKKEKSADAKPKNLSVYQQSKETKQDLTITPKSL